MYVSVSSVRFTCIWLIAWFVFFARSHAPKTHSPPILKEWNVAAVPFPSTAWAVSILRLRPHRTYSVNLLNKHSYKFSIFFTCFYNERKHSRSMWYPNSYGTWAVSVGLLEISEHKLIYVVGLFLAGDFWAQPHIVGLFLARDCWAQAHIVGLFLAGDFWAKVHIVALFLAGDFRAQDHIVGLFLAMDLWEQAHIVALFLAVDFI